MRRNWQAIRREVVMSAKTFLSESLDVEQESAMSCRKAILTRKTNAAFIENGKVLLSHLFPEDTGIFAEEVCESWSQIQDALKMRYELEVTLVRRFQTDFENFSVPRKNGPEDIDSNCSAFAAQHAT